MSLQELLDLLKRCRDMGIAHVVSMIDKGLMIEVLSDHHGVVRYHISKDEIQKGLRDMADVVYENNQCLMIEVLSDHHGVVRYHISKDEETQV